MKKNYKSLKKPYLSMKKNKYCSKIPIKLLLFANTKIVENTT